MPNFYANGIGAPLGSVLGMAKPLQTSGNIWYVRGSGGIDGASPAGQNREKPLATLAQAVTNSAANDLISLLDGHTESLLVPQVINKALTIMGEGSAAGIPTVVFRSAAGGNPVLWSITAAGVNIDNIRFQTSLQANSANKIEVSGTNFECLGCYFDCGATDTGAGLSLLGASNSRIENCTFVSVATAITSQPNTCLNCSNAPMSDVAIVGCVFDGGTVAFSNIYALDFNAVAVTRLRTKSLSFLRGADYRFNSSQTGYSNPQTVSGGIRGVW